MTDMRNLRKRAPESCPQCGDAEFEHYETGNPRGSGGACLDWLVRCRGCGGLWRAFAQISTVQAGAPLDWFGVESDARTAPRVEPRRPTAPPCPACRVELSLSGWAECARCGWLKYPTCAREKWGHVGGCPHCGFVYRWDGTTCSHCGHTRPTEPFDAQWRTDTVVSLASQMYESRDFSAMPILADALQDAGCGSADVLDHCRDEGPHVRGCWVVDLVLGKE